MLPSHCLSANAMVHALCHAVSRCQSSLWSTACSSLISTLGRPGCEPNEATVTFKALFHCIPNCSISLAGWATARYGNGQGIHLALMVWPLPFYASSTALATQISSSVLSSPFPPSLTASIASAVPFLASAAT